MLDATKGMHGTVRNRRLCGRQHHFTTVEVHQPHPSSIAGRAWSRALQLIGQWISERKEQPCR